MLRGIQLRVEFHAPPTPDSQIGSWWQSAAVSNQRVIVSFYRV